MDNNVDNSEPSSDLNKSLPYVILAIIWFSMALLALIVYFLFPPEIYFWDKVCDKCNTTTARYRYIIRFIFGSYKNTFDITKTTITIELWNSRRAIIILQIPPKQLDQSVTTSDSQNLRVCKFLLYRNESLSDINTVVVNHNGNGSINVTTIETQDIKSDQANIAYIGQPINSLTPQKANTVQMYPSATKEPRPVEPDLLPSQTLTAFEFIVLFFLAINLMLLLCVYVIPCSTEGLCGNYSEGIITSVFAGLSSSTVSTFIFVFQCVLYRYSIKHFLYRGVGKGFLSKVRYVFLIITTLMGTICGITAAITASTHLPEENPDQDYTNQIYWMIAIGIAIAVFFMFWISVLSIVGYLIGFFSTPDESPVEGLHKDMDTTVRTDSKDDEKGDDYYTSLMKGNQKVKSISQYKGINAKSKSTRTATPTHPTQPTPTPPTPTKSAKKPPVRVKSTESIGENYYQQLLKGQGKVKSVSQYKGVK